MVCCPPMSGNPKDSPWFSAGERARKRPHVHLTLPRDAILLLAKLAKATQKSRSAIVEHLIRAEAKRTHIT